MGPEVLDRTTLTKAMDLCNHHWAGRQNSESLHPTTQSVIVKEEKMTSLTRWNPLEEIANLWPRDIFNRDFFGRVRPDGGVAVEWSPRCDMNEKDDEILVHAELPGVAAKDMHVSVKDGVLTVSGEKQTEKKEEQHGRNYTERFFGSFERRLVIPANVDEARIEATLKDGVLEVHMPKAPTPEQPAPRNIEIKSA
jgi:HSP20 family protein